MKYDVIYGYVFQARDQNDSPVAISETSRHLGLEQPTSAGAEGPSS